MIVLTRPRRNRYLPFSVTYPPLTWWRGGARLAAAAIWAAGSGAALTFIVARYGRDRQSAWLVAVALPALGASTFAAVLYFLAALNRTLVPSTLRLARGQLEIVTPSLLGPTRRGIPVREIRAVSVRVTRKGGPGRARGRLQIYRRLRPTVRALPGRDPAELTRTAAALREALGLEE